MDMIVLSTRESISIELDKYIMIYQNDYVLFHVINKL